MRMAQKNAAHPPEDEWIRYRIGRLRALRDAVYDRQTLRAIDELIAEAEERLQVLEAVETDRSNG